MNPRDTTNERPKPVLAGAAASEYDAIVVGARVAGAATAMLLARRGRRVLLVDRRRPGSDTLSTHALMRAGVLQLKRWGLLDAVIAAGTPPVHKNVMRYGDVVDPIEIKPKAGVDALYAPRRTVLDTLLVEAAEASGVEVRFGVAVDGLCVDPQGRVAGIAGRDAAGVPFEATARITVGADGIRSVVALGAGAPVLHRGTGSTAVVYGYFEGSDLPTEFEFSYRTGASAGFIPTNDGQVCVWAGAPSARWLAELRHEPDLGFARMLAAAEPSAVEKVKAARLVGRLHGFAGEPSYLRQPWGPGWALVGDASHFKDPIAAHGITDALRDAELLAIAIDHAMTAGGIGEAAALERYHQTRDRLSLRMHAASDAVARYDWTTETVRDLLIEMAKSMGDEVELLSKLDAFEAGGTAAGSTNAASSSAPATPAATMIATATPAATAPATAVIAANATASPIATASALPATSPPAPRPSDEVAVAFIQALARRDWAAIERLLAPEVWMRALLPSRVHEEKTAAGALAIFRKWFDAPTTRLLEAEHHTLAGREHLCYRFLVRRDHPETPGRKIAGGKAGDGGQPSTSSGGAGDLSPWHLVEQTGFCRVKDGRISRLDLACTGFHPIATATTYEHAA
jgi:2-polyprenyl-6-methoxyphenol hydroxylase-like FAD-dependent oxidoreductase